MKMRTWGMGRRSLQRLVKKRKRKREEKAKEIRKRKISLRILGMALKAQEEPVMAQEALAWGFPWWLQLEKAKVAKKTCKG